MSAITVLPPGGGEVVGDAPDRRVEILSDPELAKRLGRAGKERARERFLTPRYLRDWLELMRDLDV